MTSWESILCILFKNNFSNQNVTKLIVFLKFISKVLERQIVFKYFFFKYILKSLKPFFNLCRHYTCQEFIAVEHSKTSSHPLPFTKNYIRHFISDNIQTKKRQNSAEQNGFLISHPKSKVLRSKGGTQDWRF